MKKLVLFILLAVGLSLATFGQDSLLAKLAKSNSVDSTDSTECDRQDVKVSSCYPNPFEGKLYINFDKELYGEVEVTVTIRDLFSGKVVYEKKFMNQQTIETTNWARGMYAIYISHYRGWQLNKAWHK